MSMLVRVRYGQYLLTLQTARRANWFSTKKPTISLERQQQILRVAQCVHELEGKPKTINLTPTKFVVPSTEPFPTDLRGEKFDIAVLRTAKLNGLLNPGIVAELDAIGFSWNGIQQKSTEAWKENLDALRIYKSIHGNLNIPSYYEVKMGDVQWPQKLWGKRLGLVVKRFRATQEEMISARRDELDSMGFIWNAIHAKWEKNLLALETYKAIHQDLLVKESFVVPDQDPNWPQDIWNLKLGKLVHNYRRAAESLPPKIREALNAMGFVWKVRDKETGPGRLPMISIAKQQQILEIVEVQYNLQGHTKYTTLPNIFTVPSTSQWPHHLHESFVEVSLLRRAHRMGLLDASIVASMDAMGFVWDVSQHQWGLFMEALCTFKTLYGHVEVPSNFQVPDDKSEWPVHLWAMKLGSKVHSVRSGKLKGTLERKQELDAMEFLWDAEELHRERILLALKTYMEIHSDLYVPKLFVVPTGDPAWPSDVAGMKLGYVVSNLRERRDSTSDKFKKQLDSLGFTWSGKRVES